MCMRYILLQLQEIHGGGNLVVMMHQHYTSTELFKQFGSSGQIVHSVSQY